MCESEKEGLAHAQANLEGQAEACPYDYGQCGLRDTLLEKTTDLAASRGSPLFYR